MLRIDQVTKTFFPRTMNERVALADVSLELAEGDFVTVIGSNGAGKSTLLNIVAGVLKQDAGSISIDGKVVDKLDDFQRARYLSRVFQDPIAGTAPTMTIEQNLALAHKRGERRGFAMAVTASKRAFYADQLAVLEQGLENRMKARVGLLSGGQRQALSLLMATFTRPRILLLDEHTAALDPQRAQLITDLTERIVAEHSLTTLMVTHNMEQALKLGNRLVMMHEGRIILEIAGEEKKRTQVSDLLNEFAKTKGAVIDDRTLLQS
jgi:putative ABC transport system ATP-binding protein